MPKEWKQTVISRSSVTLHRELYGQSFLKNFTQVDFAPFDHYYQLA